MAETKWPDNRRVIGAKVPRLDGPGKATGTARYSYDINRKGLLQAMILRSPYAHAKIVSIDTGEAEKTPGFKALYKIKNPGQEVYYAGDEILAIAADTEEHALDCIHAVKIQYEPLEFLVNEETALKNPQKKTVPGQGPNVKNPVRRNDGNVDTAFQTADAIIEASYGIPVQTHVCLETHGMVAEWQGDDLTVWCSTQAVAAVAGQDLTNYFRPRVPDVKVRCITHYMGGGYGCKFGSGVEGRTCAELARIAKAPVKLFLNREEEHVSVGNRPSAYAKIKIGGTKDGKITAFTAETHGTGGFTRGPDSLQSIPYIYAVPNVRNEHRAVNLNAGNAQAMRAPGHPQYCFLTESAVDDLANKLGLDPMQMRLKNLPTGALPNTTVTRDELYRKEIEIAAKMCNWDKTWHPPGKGPSKGPVKHGIGMAIHTWGGQGRADNDVKVTINSNGSVLVQSSTQDLGTGERTVLAIVTAEVLGLEPKDITSQIGESQFGRSTGSGGSTTCPGTAPAALNAASAARDDFFVKIASRLTVKKEDLKIDPAKPGKVIAGDKELSWKEACAKLGMEAAVGQGNWTPGLSSVTVGGVQVAEVMVDTETGVVYPKKIYAVQDCGLIINKLGCESQVAGGVIMGVHYAMFEDRILDEHTGRQVNPDMEFYKLAGMRDIPEIIVHMHDMPERGVIGIGEPPTISTAAAIGNAICNAIGVRVPRMPFSPDKVLAALAKGGAA
jgi:xanthine dehydrogenase YagR molybdenum-binding subunit